MKYLYQALLLCFPFWAAAQERSTPQLSPYTRHYLSEIKIKPGALPFGFAYRKLADNKTYVSALIKVADAQKAAKNIETLGGAVGTKAGDIWTVQVPAQKIAAFVKLAGISYIELDHSVKPALDEARITTRVDSVHKGIGLPMVYSGKDVVVGVIDFGFDYNHPCFYDTNGTGYRVKKVWELNTSGTPPAGYVYGHEITDTNAIKAQGTDNAEQTHGTAVTGIAAGSGVGSAPASDRFRGMAYDADLVLVGVRRDTIGTQWLQGSFTDFIDGVNYIFTHAASVQKPAVVNISWGSQSGPHDGTTLFNQACDNLSGKGKIIVMSAGNEGQEDIHIGKTFSPNDTLLQTFVTFTSQNYKRTWVDIWGDTNKTFCAQVTLFRNGVAGNSTGFVCLDNGVHSLYLIGDNGVDTCYAEFITSTADFNGKPRLTINIFNKAVDSIMVSVKGNDGAINMWDEYYFYGYKYGYQSEFNNLNLPGVTGGDNTSTSSDMGSAMSVLLVGAYASKTDFTNINGTFGSYSSYVMKGRLVPFSSRGPTIDGRTKPDITAPGLTLATAVSSYDTSYTAIGSNKSLTISSYVHPLSGKTFYYAEFIGTSASAPVASGIVALLLQVDSTLTPAQLKSLLFSTAIKDMHTGSLPPNGYNNFWGHGKINAYGAIKKLVQQTGVYNFNGRKLDCVLFPNPGTGKFTLDYTSDKAESLMIEVFNITGSRIVTDSWKVSEGTNRREINLSHYPQGVYLVNISSSRGGSVQIKTVMQ